MKCSSLEMWNSGSVASFSLRQSRVTAPNCKIIKGIDVVVLKPRNCKMKTFQRMYKYNIFDIWCLRYIGMALRRVLNGTLCKTDTAVMFSSAKEKTKKENRKKEYENWREAKEIKSFCSVQVRPFHAGLFQINFIFNRASKVTKKKRKKERNKLQGIHILSFMHVPTHWVFLLSPAKSSILHESVAVHFTTSHKTLNTVPCKSYCLLRTSRSKFCTWRRCKLLLKYHWHVLNGYKEPAWGPRLGKSGPGR